jgi:hypothetical protein
VHRPAVHAFVLRLSAAVGFVVMGADCTNAYANSPSPTQSTYVRIDDAYADWYRSHHGKEADLSFVLPVLKALQGHPEAGALWEKHINKTLDDLDIVYTTHERSIYRGTIDGKVVLLYRQVNDIAVACSDPQGFIDSIGKVVDLKSQGILSSFNGIDIDQRREYVKISCQSYLTRMLKTLVGWILTTTTSAKKLLKTLLLTKSQKDYDPCNVKIDCLTKELHSKNNKTPKANLKFKDSQ